MAGYTSKHASKMMNDHGDYKKIKKKAKSSKTYTSGAKTNSKSEGFEY